MKAQELRYSFEQKADKLSSKSFANLKLASIVFLLNEGMQNFIMKRYGINNNYRTSFEETQKRRDELQVLIVPNKEVDIVKDKVKLSDLPGYMFMLRCRAIGERGSCKKTLRGIIAQTDDLDLIATSSIDNESFEWGEVPYRLADNHVEFIKDDSFKLISGIFDYMRYPKAIDIAGYTHFNGSPSTDVDCELPNFTHSQIVDEAILIYDTSFTNPDIQSRLLAIQNAE